MTKSPDPAEVARGLSPAMRRAVLYRERASEPCMSWATARRLHELGIMPRVTRYQRLTRFGLRVRTAIEGMEGG